MLELKDNALHKHLVASSGDWFISPVDWYHHLTVMHKLILFSEPALLPEVLIHIQETFINTTYCMIPLI